MSVVTGVAAGCAPSRGTVGGPIEPILELPPLLSWIGDFSRPGGAAYPLLTSGGRFGGLSGLVHDARSDQWIAVIDDREGTRVAWLDVALTNDSVSVVPTRLMPLRAGRGIPARIASESDLEAIVALSDGTLLMSEEGHTRDGEVWQPAILHVTRAGVVTATTAFPPMYSITTDPARGVRDNQGFESLTLTPGGRLIAGLEQPLLEDGEKTTFDRPGLGRLIEFRKAGSRWRPGREWRYMISPTPRVEGFPNVCGDGENGLVELLALTETRLLALERACLMDDARTQTTNPIHLYLVELIGDGTRKTLLLDLSTLAPRLPPSLSRLDNFEGMAFGPPLADGSRTLLVVSDDNFRATQLTSFLLFGIR